jgi:hypothetical protein
VTITSRSKGCVNTIIGRAFRDAVRWQRLARNAPCNVTAP